MIELQVHPWVTMHGHREMSTMISSSPFEVLFLSLLSLMSKRNDLAFCFFVVQPTDEELNLARQMLLKARASPVSPNQLK